MKRGLHLRGKGAAVLIDILLRKFNSGVGLAFRKIHLKCQIYLGLTFRKILLN